MEWLITRAVTAWLVPPGSLLLLALCGALLMVARRRRLGGALILLSGAALYSLSTQFVAGPLLASLEPPPLEPHANKSGEVIVVLGGGTYFSAPEYGVDTVGDLTLVRLRYAARLQKALDKPLLVSGGSPAGSLLPEADQMRQTLQLDFHVPVQWSESGSNNTLENARLSYRLLKSAGLTRIYLVTHAWHMPRARLAFERAGFTVIAAPTGYTTHFKRTLLDFLPSALALMHSRYYFHELIGIGWYHLRLSTGR
jgi:uncharacterized SAM-binding protein YcdF (DUF218 family)